MKGAIAVPLVNTNNTPNNKRIIIRGNNQNFFLILRKPQRSFKKSILEKLIGFINVIRSKEVIPGLEGRILV